MDPPDLVTTIGKPKIKKIRVKYATTKRAREWAHSRKGTKMTCSKYGSSTHNARTYKLQDLSETLKNIWTHLKSGDNVDYVIKILNMADVMMMVLVLVNESHD